MLQIVKNQNDFYTSVEKALDEIDPKWKTYNGVVIVGSHKPENINQKIEIIRMCREQNIPILCICMGHQLMAIEFAKNVLGISDANSEELEPTLTNSVVVKMPQLRVGIFPVIYEPQKPPEYESYWHNYKINDNFAQLFTRHFDIIVSTSAQFGNILDYMKLKDHPHFVGVQSHPEYQSSKEKPHKVLVAFINACKANKTMYAV